MSDPKDLLRAPFELAYTYKRSNGPVMSKFFECLGERKILGTKSSTGKVFAPAAEFDPDTHEALSEIIEVGPGGVVETFSWIENPQHHHLIKQPFAFALIKLDGADTSMLHMITNCDESDLCIGSRVTAMWSETQEQRITDIQFFTLES
ncbi:OB-fold domain-containing protein [Gammaproteobacteria bacterium]|nr:OB-fold domain-containing protein [Gammaproteobacteria bacterium]